MGKIRKLLRKQGFSLLVFFLALMFFGWPILSLFNESRHKTTFIYLFSIWGILILLLFFMSRSFNKSSSEDNKND